MDLPVIFTVASGCSAARPIVEPNNILPTISKPTNMLRISFFFDSSYDCPSAN
jgi:hypothetical protein